MSKTDSPSWDDLDEPEETSSEDGEYVDLEPGSEVSGTITDVDLDAGFHGEIDIDGRTFSLNRTLREQMLSSLVTGGVVIVRKSEDEQSFQDDEGETITYHEKKARFGRPGGDN